MRILILEYKDVWHSEAGGAEVYVDAIAHEWVRAGHDVTIFSSRNGRPDWEVFDDIKFIRHGSKFSVFRNAISFMRHHTNEFDLILDCVNQRPFLAHKVAADRSAALVLHLGFELWDSEFAFPLNVIGRRVLEPRWMAHLKDARSIIAISNSTALSLDHYGIRCDAIIPPAMPRVLGFTPRKLTLPPRLLFIGRLVRNKRPQDALTAFEIIRRDFPGARLDLVGTGYLLPELRRVRDDSVHVHGFVSEETKRDLLSRAHALLVPSTREGWGIVVNEASASGVPSIAYDVPGLRDSVIDGVTGILCENSPAAMAKHASALLRDADRWARMSNSGMRHADECTWERAARHVLSNLTTQAPHSHPANQSSIHPAVPGSVAGSAAQLVESQSTAGVSMPGASTQGHLYERRASWRFGNEVSTVLALASLAAGLALRVITAFRMPWRDDEIVYVKWTGAWFANHFWPYLFQFQQNIHPPRSPYFANPPLAMWLFGAGIRIGRLFGASPLISARMTDVAIGTITGLLLYVVVRRWLGPSVALIVVATYSLLPLIVVTNASAFLETTSTFLAVSAFAILLRLRRNLTLGNSVLLGLVLGLFLLTKLSLVVVPLGIGGLAVYSCFTMRRPRLAALLVAISILFPVAVWSGFRTPSQYVGVFSFLQSKYTGALYIDHWRFPFALLSDVPVVLLLGWLATFPSLDRRTREGLARFSAEIVLVAVLPVAGIAELLAAAPTSFDYQLVPLMPFLLVAAAWTLTTFAATVPRLIPAVLGTFAFGELLCLLFAVPIGFLSLSTTPAGSLVRSLDPSIDVRYGTGSEGLPSVGAYINQRLPRNARIAASLADYTLQQYVQGPRTIGPWFPNQPINDLVEDGYEYAVFVDHEVPMSSPARTSISMLRPIFRVSLNGQTLASVYKVPAPPLASVDLLGLSPSWHFSSKSTRIVEIRSQPNALAVRGTPTRPGSTEFLTATNARSVVINLHQFGLGFYVTSLGGSENIYVDFLNLKYPRLANYWRATVFVNWIGTLRVVVPFDEFKPVRLLPRQALPSLTAPLLLRLGTDSQVGTVPYIGASTVQFPPAS